MLKNINQAFFSTDNKPLYNKSLDGLRGIAVLLVLLSHSSHEDIFIHEFFDLRRIGKMGVYLFFVLSAYLLDRQIALAFMSNKFSFYYWTNYLLRRFLRIFPLFFLSLLVSWLLVSFGEKSVINGFKDVLKHLFLVEGKGIYWSIPVEFKYYLISPFIMWICHKYFKWEKNKILFFFLSIITLSVFSGVLLKFSSISTFRFLPIFMVGTSISVYELLYKNNISIYAGSKKIDIVGFASFFAILLTVPYYFKKVFGFTFNLHLPLFYTPYAVLWAIVLLSTTYGYGWLKKLASITPLRFLGKISFSAYLFHLPILSYVDRALIPQELKIYLFLAITIAVSTITFLLIEKPLSKIYLSQNGLKEHTTPAK